ncbi:MAG: hypothetical protein JNJ88_13125 [Planctomycetes bacterium]|nr:hypothetical protein [Planctomycetota bacterium]
MDSHDIVYPRPCEFFLEHMEELRPSSVADATLAPLLRSHAQECASCREAWTRRSSLLDLLEGLSSVAPAVPAPEELDARVSRVAEPEPFVRSVMCKMEPVAAPRELDAILAHLSSPEPFVRAVVRSAEPLAAPAELDARVLTRLGARPARRMEFVLGGAVRLWERTVNPGVAVNPRVAVPLAAVVIAAVGLTLLLPWGNRAKAPQGLVFEERSIADLPLALRSQAEFLAGAVPGSRKGR